MISVQLIGGPTALIEIGGVRLLTDPTVDPPGDHPVGRRMPVKTGAPAVTPDALGRVDAVLLSHDQHPDNLDDAGRGWQHLVEDPETIPAAFAARGLADRPLMLRPGEITEVPGR